MLCRCGCRYNAREADLARGWGFSCSKECAARRRDFGGKRAKRVDGKPIPQQRKRGARRLAIDSRVTDAQRLAREERDVLNDLDCDSWADSDYHNHDL